MKKKSSFIVFQIGILFFYGKKNLSFKGRDELPTVIICYVFFRWSYSLNISAKILASSQFLYLNYSNHKKHITRGELKSYEKCFSYLSYLFVIFIGKYSKICIFLDLIVALMLQ